MPHPIYGPPQHELEVVRLALSLPTLRNGRTTGLSLMGGSSTKRGNLWSYREQWAGGDATGLAEVVDMAHWVMLAAAQDRPASQAALEEALTPPGWEDVTLPY